MKHERLERHGIGGAGGDRDQTGDDECKGLEHKGHIADGSRAVERRENASDAFELGVLACGRCSGHGGRIRFGILQVFRRLCEAG